MYDFINTEWKQQLIILDDVIRHSHNVTFISGIIADALPLSDIEKRFIKCTATYHDIGKGFVNQNILYKKEELTRSEKNDLKKHAKLGADYMRKNKHLKAFSDYVLYHHENYDGTGYFGLKGEKIPVVSRVIRMADYFDALCDNRPYRDAYSIPEAVKILQDDSKVFDPRIYNLFMDLLSDSKTAGRFEAIYASESALV